MDRSRVAVVTDSAASVPPGAAAELGIEVVPLYLRVGDQALKDDADVSGFYDRLRGGEVASTSSPSPGDFQEAFQRTGAGAIVCISVAASVSGVHQAARLAGDLVEATVEVVDSGNASMGQGFVALEAARAARDGADLPAVAARAREVADRAELVALIEQFEHLQRSGRVSRLVSYAGTMLGIRPVFRLHTGTIEALGRPRTRRRAMDRVAEAAERLIDGRPVHLAGVHAAAEADARELLERIGRLVQVKERHVVPFTPAMGAHTGPGVVGLAWFCE